MKSFGTMLLTKSKLKKAIDKKKKVDSLTKNYLTSYYESLLLYYQIELKKPIDPAAALLYDTNAMLEIAKADQLKLIKEIEESFIEDKDSGKKELVKLDLMLLMSISLDNTRQRLIRIN